MNVTVRTDDDQELSVDLPAIPPISGTVVIEGKPHTVLDVSVSDRGQTEIVVKAPTKPVDLQAWLDAGGF